MSGSLVLSACSADTSIPPPAAPTTATAGRMAQALETVAGLGSALRDGDADAAAGFGSADGAGLLRSAAGNVDRLDLGDIELRYIQELASTTVAGTRAFGPDSWQATVAVQYRLLGWDQTPTRIETTFTFVPGPSGPLVAAIGSDVGRTPLWLAGPVTAVISGRTLVLAAGSSGSRESRLAQRAIRDVNRVIPRWRGRLVVESPATAADFYRVLGTTPEQYGSIAAVTATVDGSSRAGSPLHVFLNPALFTGLGPRAAQIVVTHESTHVATAAPFTQNMPTWLLEGFADYVALAHSGVGVQTAAAQILKRLRKDGLPDALPSDEDLVPTAPGLGAAYEEAWLVNRFIARSYGEPRLIAFYDAIDGGSSVAGAFDRVLGTTQDRFVAAWRADLRALLNGVTG